MNLEKLLANNKLVKYEPTKRQIDELLDLVKRDLNDAKISALSLDRRFISLYSAAQTLATIVLYKNGYRTRGEGHHRTTFEAASILLPKEVDILEYFDRCRILRNKSEYERSGIVSEAEAKSLEKRVNYFRGVIEKIV